MMQFSDSTMQYSYKYIRIGTANVDQHRHMTNVYIIHLILNTRIKWTASTDKGNVFGGLKYIASIWKNSLKIQVSHLIS